MQRKEKSVTFNPVHGGFDVDLVLRIRNPQVIAELKSRMKKAAARFPRQSDLLEQPENFCVVLLNLAVNLEQVDQLRQLMESMHNEFDDKSLPIQLTSQGDLIQHGIVNRIPVALIEPTAELAALCKRAKTLAKDLHLKSHHLNKQLQPLIKLFARGTSITSLDWMQGAEAIPFTLPPASLLFVHRNAHGNVIVLDDEVLSQFEVDLSDTKVAVGAARAAFFQPSPPLAVIKKLNDSQPLLKRHADAISDDEDANDLHHEYTDPPALQKCCRIL